MLLPKASRQLLSRLPSQLRLHLQQHMCPCLPRGNVAVATAAATVAACLLLFNLSGLLLPPFPSLHLPPLWPLLQCLADRQFQRQEAFWWEAWCPRCPSCTALMLPPCLLSRQAPVRQLASFPPQRLQQPPIPAQKARKGHQRSAEDQKQLPPQKRSQVPPPQKTNNQTQPTQTPMTQTLKLAQQLTTSGTSM